jgi:hypothetical protein
MKESDIDPYDDIAKIFERICSYVSTIDNAQELLFMGLLCERLAQQIAIRMQFMKHKSDMPGT